MANEPQWTVSAGTVISFLASAIAGISVFFTKRYIDKVDQLEAEAVRKRELKELEEKLTNDRREMHAENLRKLTSIETGLAQANQRMDSILFELNGRAGGRDR